MIALLVMAGAVLLGGMGIYREEMKQKRYEKRVRARQWAWFERHHSEWVTLAQDYPVSRLGENDLSLGYGTFTPQPRFPYEAP